MRQFNGVILCVSICIGLFFSSLNAQDYYPEKDTLVLEKLEKWQDMKFGLLMHWGPYSQWGIVESWSICGEDEGWCRRSMDDYHQYKERYEMLKGSFNPIEFDPVKWAQAASGAGMRYVVFTTKHHDGFCMFDSKYTDYKITDEDCPFSSNPKANVTKGIFDAFRDKGFWTGTYFSKPDWHCEYYWWPYFPTPDRNVNYDPELYPERWNNYINFTHNQILELMTDYGPVDILWLDGGWVAKLTEEEIRGYYDRLLEKSNTGFIKKRIVNQDIHMDDLVEKCREKQPGLIVVDRAVPGKNQNYLTPENHVPEEALPYPWESCIIAGGGWSWVDNARYKSSHQVVQMLVDIVSKGGNLLLNIAPGPKGQWHDEAYILLDEVGEWMDVNNEAIYQTRAIEPYKMGNVCFTRNKDNNTVYAFYMVKEDEKSMPGEIIIPGFKPEKKSKVSLLGYKKNLDYSFTDEGFIIHLPERITQDPPSKHVWVFKFMMENEQN